MSLEPSAKTQTIESLFKSYDYGQCTARELFICLDEIESIYNKRISQRQKQDKLGEHMDRDLACYITDFFLDYVYLRVIDGEDISKYEKQAKLRKEKEISAARKLINKGKFIEMYK